jgi:hypothetical protein
MPPRRVHLTRFHGVFTYLFDDVTDGSDDDWLESLG